MSEESRSSIIVGIVRASRLIFIFVVAVAGLALHSSAQILAEGFESATFPPAGWVVQNNSTIIGTNGNCWNRFTTTPWAPHTGVGHAGANFNCTSGANTISGWLIGPNVIFENGQRIRFWTRKGAVATDFPDRLELRLSTNGAGTFTGTTADSVGDFVTLLVSVNPTLVTGVYPTAFTEFTGIITGLPGPTSGRFAFRYYVTNGGPTGANSDIISIDDVVLQLAPTPAGVSVSGLVQSARGRGLADATVEITSFSGVTRRTTTSDFGYFTFEDVEVGQDYVLNVVSRRYSFVPQVVNVSDTITDLIFTPVSVKPSKIPF